MLLPASSKLDIQLGSSPQLFVALLMMGAICLVAFFSQVPANAGSLVIALLFSLLLLKIAADSCLQRGASAWQRLVFSPAIGQPEAGKQSSNMSIKPAMLIAKLTPPWRLIAADGSEFAGQLLPGSTVNPWLVALRIESPAGKTVALCIAADSVTAEQHRQLRMLLRSGKVNKRKSVSANPLTANDASDARAGNDQNDQQPPQPKEAR